MRKARLRELQAGIKIAGRGIINLRYVDDTTLKAKSEEQLKNLLMRVKEESERASLKLHIKKTKIMALCPITSWQIEGDTRDSPVGKPRGKASWESLEGKPQIP